MSVLSFPRLYFRGEISWDPCVANNSTLIYDAARAKLVLPPGVTLEQYKQFLLANPGTYGIWNYFGTHDARFDKVLITGGAVEPHRPTVTKDALVGKEVSMCGKLVDVDPAAVHTSQIFFDDIIVGDEAAGFAGLRHQRMHSRWINFQRNLGRLPIAGAAAVAWQTTLTKDGLQFFGETDSALLQTFTAALRRDDVAGLMIRFQTYRTLYFQNGIRNDIPQRPRSTADLQQLYTAGENFSNPAYSALVGVVGLWMRGEPVSAPGGRYLVPTAQALQANVTPGPAVFELDENTRTLSFDFGSTIPEQDANLEKVDLGDLVFLADNQGTTIATLEYAAYSRASYEERAGIIDIDLSSNPDPAIIEKIRQGQLAVNTVLNGQTAEQLTESPFLVAADERGVYLDEGETKKVRLFVLLSGQPAPAGTRIMVNSYDSNLNFVQTVATLTLDAPGTAEMTCAASFEQASVAPTEGILTFQFLPYAAGQPAPKWPYSFNPMSDFFITVRTLPFDDALAANTPDEQLTWDFVYNNILRVYDSFNPVMSRTSDPAIYKPLDNQARMKTLAQAIKRVIAEATFESSRHMPITRDMSRGRRALLTRWCDLVLAGTAPDIELVMQSMVAAFDSGLSAGLNLADEPLKDPRTGRV